MSVWVVVFEIQDTDVWVDRSTSVSLHETREGAMAALEEMLEQYAPGAEVEDRGRGAGQIEGTYEDGDHTKYDWEVSLRLVHG